MSKLLKDWFGCFQIDYTEWNTYLTLLFSFHKFLFNYSILFNKVIEILPYTHIHYIYTVCVYVCVYGYIYISKLCHFIYVSPNQYYFLNSYFNKMKNKNLEIVSLVIPIFASLLKIYVSMSLYYPIWIY